MRRTTVVLGATLAAAIGAVLWLRTDAGRRLLIGWLGGVPVVGVAAPATTLEPVFDGADAQRPRQEVHLVPVASGIEQPVDLAPVPGTDRWVVLSKTGTASTFRPGEAPTPWFTVPVETASELGLLGIAFHPQFATNGRFFLNYNPSTKGGGSLRTRIARWHAEPGSLASPTEEAVVLEIDQPYQNHDGGQVAFGPDGKLYVGMGDGGYRGDPKGHGQDRSTLLGDLLRLDVDAPGVPYAVPPDNPFVGTPGVAPEIWAWGLRNPWRFSFAPDGRLVVGDVGQNTLEEIDLVEKGDNLGWNVREGDRCYAPAEGCDPTGLVDPIWTYGRDDGVSVTGGVVWTAPGPLAGRYLFADFGSGRLWALELPESRRRAAGVTALGRFTWSPTAFARTPDGKVWAADFQRGAIYSVEPR